MAISNLNEFISLLPYEYVACNKNYSASKGAGYWHDLMTITGNPPAMSTPVSTGVTLDNTASFAFPFTDATVGKKKVLCRFEWTSSNTTGFVTIYDRLWHNSGFVVNVITPQTIASPPTLPRYADGEGVELWFQVYTAGGTSNNYQISASYTNQASVSGRTATYNSPVSGYLNSAGFMNRFTLQDGDSGVETVASVTVSANGGTAGNFGLVLLKPLATFEMDGNWRSYRSYNLLKTGLVEIPNETCLCAKSQTWTTNVGMQELAFSYMEIDE